jgi:hypothetical protein
MSKEYLFSVIFLLTGCFSTKKNNCNYTLEDKNYEGRSAKECEVIDYKCAAQWKSFEDACGCGCYKTDEEIYSNEILSIEPAQEAIDVTGMGTFKVIDKDVSVTFYLAENQSMGFSGDEIKFNTADSSKELPIKILVKNTAPEKYALSCAGCSLSKRGVLYVAKNWSDRGFRILVSIMDDNDTAKALKKFKLVITDD